MRPHAHNLAAFNLGRLLHDWDDPRVAAFKQGLDRVNAVGERMPGFVWRLGDDEMEQAQLDPEGALGGDARIASALSVWESPEALRRFVFKTVHGRFYARGQEWFETWDSPRLVMWWIPEGEIPSVADGVARLRRLTDEGPSDAAFGWDHLEQARARDARNSAAAEAA